MRLKSWFFEETEKHKFSVKKIKKNKQKIVKINNEQEMKKGN